MKTLQELEAIRQKTLDKIAMRKDGQGDGVRIVIGMATCGIAAGARPVMSAFMEEIDRRRLRDVTVTQTGCIGMCRLEPMVDVIDADGNKVTYVKVDPEKARMIVADHVVNGQPVKAYTIGAVDAQG